VSPETANAEYYFFMCGFLIKLMVSASFCENFATKKSMRLVNNFVTPLITANFVLTEYEGGATNWGSQTTGLSYVAIGRKIGPFLNITMVCLMAIFGILKKNKNGSTNYYSGNFIISLPWSFHGKAADGRIGRKIWKIS
jgi:hypothetical protein